MVFAHYLALDTAAAGLFWGLLAASLLGASPVWPEISLSAAGVWLVYAADRWLDSFPGSREEKRAPRHQFAGRNRPLILSTWFIVFLTALVSGLISLSSKELAAGATAIALAAAYLLLAQNRRESNPVAGYPKSAVVALLIAVAVCVFPMIRSGEPIHYQIWVFFSFSLLFFFQTLATRLWEKGQSVPAILPITLFVYALAVTGSGGEGSLSIASLMVGLGIVLIDRIPVADKVSLADWALALAGLFSWVSLEIRLHLL